MKNKGMIIVLILAFVLMAIFVQSNPVSAAAPERLSLEITEISGHQVHFTVGWDKVKAYYMGVTLWGYPTNNINERAVIFGPGVFQIPDAPVRSQLPSLYSISDADIQTGWSYDLEVQLYRKNRETAIKHTYAIDEGKPYGYGVE